MLDHTNFEHRWQIEANSKPVSLHKWQLLWPMVIDHMLAHLFRCKLKVADHENDNTQYMALIFEMMDNQTCQLQLLILLYLKPGSDTKDVEAQNLAALPATSFLLGLLILPIKTSFSKIA